MITLSLSEKLLQLLAGAQIPASQLKHELITELISEGIIAERIAGRTKRTLYMQDVAAFSNWLFNKHSIPDLSDYITVLKDEASTRADLVQAGNDSKIRSRRTFRGFLANSYLPIDGQLNGKPYTIHPVAGTFQFIYDFEHYAPSQQITVIGIENVENFRWIEKQQQLFSNFKPLFVSRYPQEQSKDLIKWLTAIPNHYVHFGDFDFAGINIYLQEYKKYLGDRASFFIPYHIESLIARYGNSKLYDQQQLNSGIIQEQELQHLVSLLHKYKRGLEQEALLLPQP